MTPIPCKLICLSLLFAVFSAVPLPAQISSGGFEKVNIEINGSKDWGLNSLVQDHDGYIWFSGTEGLIRYDGYEPKVYKHIPGDSTSLAGNSGEKIFVDYRGDLWVSSGTGVSRFDPACDCFFHYTIEANELSPKGVNTTSILAFAEDLNNNLWMVSHGGLYRYERESDQFTQFLDDPADPNTLIKDILRVLLADRNGNIWIGTGYGSPEIGGGLIRFNPTTGKVKRFLHDPLDPSSLLDNRVSALMEDREGKIWVGTYQCGLHQFNPNAENFVRMMPEAENPNALSAPCGEAAGFGNGPFVQLLHQDQQGGYWIGTLGVGLNHFNPNTGKLNFYNPIEQSGSNFPWTFYEDQQAQLWLGYIGTGGLYKMDSYARKFQMYPEIQAMQRSCESQLERGIYWIGTFRTGLYRLDINTGKIKHFLHDPEDNSSSGQTAVSAAYEDREGTLWLGLGHHFVTSKKAGLARLDRQSGSFKYYDIKPNDSIGVSNNVYGIYEDQKGFLWLNSQLLH